jgi:hypothetical protein
MKANTTAKKYDRVHASPQQFPLPFLQVKYVPAYPRGNPAAVPVKIDAPSLFFKQLFKMGKLKIFFECIKVDYAFWF